MPPDPDARKKLSQALIPIHPHPLPSQMAQFFFFKIGSTANQLRIGKLRSEHDKRGQDRNSSISKSCHSAPPAQKTKRLHIATSSRSLSSQMAAAREAVAMGKHRIKPNYRRRTLRLPDLDHCKMPFSTALARPPRVFGANVRWPRGIPSETRHPATRNEEQSNFVPRVIRLLRRD